LALMNFMRLSSMKAAHVPRTGNPGISLVFREMGDTADVDR
jgi:hypothetical protein